MSMTTLTTNIFIPMSRFPKKKSQRRYNNLFTWSHLHTLQRFNNITDVRLRSQILGGFYKNNKTSWTFLLLMSAIKQKEQSNLKIQKTRLSLEIRRHKWQDNMNLYENQRWNQMLRKGKHFLSPHAAPVIMSPMSYQEMKSTRDINIMAHICQ